MSGFKSFAVVGAGNIGTFIVDELLQAKIAGDISSLAAVSRSNDIAVAHPEWVSNGVKIIVIDYDSPQTIVDAFSGVDVVISVLGGSVEGLLRQQDLVVAAKSALVKLFVPSEFACPSDPNNPFYPIKIKITDKIREIDLPYTIFYPGVWSDVAFSPFFGWDFENGNVNIGGEGNALISFTTRSDIARFVSYVLVNLPASDLERKTFRIEGDRTSWNKVVESYETKTGKKLNVSYTPRSTIEEKIKNNPHDFINTSLLYLDTGAGVVGDVTDNTLWPEWKPKRVIDVIA